ncbi:hypothetical protein D3C78_940210 [compost metagenome]
MHFLFAESADQRLGDLVGAARVGHQLAEHGAQGQDDADKAEHAAETVLERFHHLGHRHAGGQAEKAGGQGQGDKRVDLEVGNQQHQADDGDDCIEQQVGISCQTKHGSVPRIVIFVGGTFAAFTGRDSAILGEPRKQPGSGRSRQQRFTAGL